MFRRPFVLAATFPLVFGAHFATAQASSRPARVGAVVAGPKDPAVESSGAVVAAPKATGSQPATNKPRIAGIAAAPPVVPAQNSPPTAGRTAQGVAAFFYLPAVVLTDGRVFANFNGRSEQVLRRCPVTSGPLPPGFATPTCWMIDGQGRYLVVQQR